MALHPGADLEELTQRTIDVVFEWFMGAIVLAVDEKVLKHFSQRRFTKLAVFKIGLLPQKTIVTSIFPKWDFGSVMSTTDF
jgi:hypothetical protein